MIRPIHQQYIVKGGGSLPDPVIFCPTNGYIDPTQPNDDWLILPKTTIKYGLLYNGWVGADARNIANIGWEVLSDTKWNTLIAYIGGTSMAYKLKESAYWSAGGTSPTNEFLFNLRAIGYRNAYNGSFVNPNEVSYIYTSTYNGAIDAGMDCYKIIYNVYNSDGISTLTNLRATLGGAIRLVKTTTSLTNGQTGTYIGNDLKVYRTICIDGIEYLADNLAETRFRNGDWVTGFDGGTYTPITNANWIAKRSEACCAYLDNLANV